LVYMATMSPGCMNSFLLLNSSSSRASQSIMVESFDNFHFVSGFFPIMLLEVVPLEN
jgi:hypothetical protein